MGHGRHSALERIARIELCANESDVNAEMTPLLRDLCVEQYLFFMIQQTKASPDPVRYSLLGGCSARVLNNYWGRRWFLNDPYVQRALSSEWPITGSQLGALTKSQIEMLAVDGEEGIQSSLAVAARSTNTAAVLRLGSKLTPSNGGERQMLANHILFIALANVLLSKQLSLQKCRAAKRYALDPKEISILQLAYSDHSASVIAARLGISKHTVHKAYQGINEKMHVKNVREAVGKAAFEGLIV